MVRQRHDDIQKIERDFIELSEMFTDLSNMIIAQEPAVEKINEQSQQVVENIQSGTKHVDTAIESGKARNRKKWWCVLITSKSGVHKESFDSISSSFWNYH